MVPLTWFTEFTVTDLALGAEKVAIKFVISVPTGTDTLMFVPTILPLAFGVEKENAVISFTGGLIVNCKINFSERPASEITSYVYVLFRSKLLTVTPLCCTTPFNLTIEPAECVKFAIKFWVEVPYGIEISIIFVLNPSALKYPWITPTTFTPEKLYDINSAS